MSFKEGKTLNRRIDFKDHGFCSADVESLITPGIYYPPNKQLHRKRRRCTRLKYPRAVLKNGEFNVDKPSPNHKFKFLSNWFITMVESRWRWTLLNFFIAFTADWLFFGFIYWLIALSHGDLKFEHLPPNTTVWKPCIRNIYGFTSTFLFSVEVHTTLAYGRRAVTLECPQAIFAMCIQCILSSIFQAFMVGILFAKLTRPKGRAQTILFSKHAVVNVRDDKLCLMFRVGDMRKSRILNIKALMYIVRLDTRNLHLDFYNSEQIELEVELDGCESTFFLWPVTGIHVINERSPLYDLSAADLLCGKIEILVVFEGTIESTGQPVQARCSYTESEILWGHRFIPLVEYKSTKNIYDVDFSKLSVTEYVDTPLCSPKEYESLMTTLLTHKYL